MPISEEEANLNVAHFVTLAGTGRWDLLENKLPGPLLEKLASQWLDTHALDLRCLRSVPGFQNRRWGNGPISLSATNKRL